MTAPVLRRSRRREAGRMAAAAVRYASIGWPVCAGAHPRRARGTGRACSCDRVGCPAPGAHPISAAWQIQATSDPAAAGRYWLDQPDANVILATGRIFDVLDVPAAAGTAALALMQDSDVEPGPVAVGCGDRALFFVATRGAALDEGEWWSCHLDCEPENVAQIAGLRWHCRDSFVLAPPSRDAAGLIARWVLPPDERPLPDALRLLEFLADAADEVNR